MTLTARPRWPSRASVAAATLCVCLLLAAAGGRVHWAIVSTEARERVRIRQRLRQAQRVHRAQVAGYAGAMLTEAVSVRRQGGASLIGDQMTDVASLVADRVGV